MNSLKRFRLGLVVGKFSPLHHGHALLIDTALAACDELLIISYSKPELARCGRDNRERWLHTQFPKARLCVIDDEALGQRCFEAGVPYRSIPDNNASDQEQRLFVTWLCQRLLHAEIDAVFTSESYGEGFASLLQQQLYGPASTRTVSHVCVDQPRQRIRISATAIRRNPFKHRNFLCPEVYADLVARVVLVGGESSGKTALAAALAESLDTCWAPEYGRELWERRAGNLAFEDMLHIAETQVAREVELARRARGWLVCDTSPLTTLFYSHHLFGRAEAALAQLARRPYDLTILSAPDFPFVQDGTRDSPALRAQQHAWYQAELARRGIAYTLCEGPIERRIEQVVSALKAAESAPYKV